MIRTLLTTTAVAMLMGTAAIAQTTPAPAPTHTPATTTEAPATAPADATAPAQVDAAPVDTGAAQTTEVNEPWDMSAGYVAAGSRIARNPARVRPMRLRRDFLSAMIAGCTPMRRH